MGFEIPGVGVVVGPNITPDKETGIGGWSPEQIVTTLQTGQRPDGRLLAPIMPWRAFAHLTKDVAMAIAAFLQSVKPVKNQIPDPVKPGEKVSTFMLRILAKPQRRHRNRDKIRLLRGWSTGLRS